MAITLDTALGTGNAGASATTTLTTTAAGAVGGRAILLVGRFNTTGTNTMSVTTTGGLTWAEDHTVTSGSLRISQFSAAMPAGLASSTALVVTHAGTNPANTDSIIAGLSLLGIDTVSPVSALNGGGASTAAWSSLTVGANSGDAIVGGAFEDGAGATSSTPTSPGVEWVDLNIAGQAETLTGVYKLSVAGSDSVAGTWSGAVGHAALGVAYKAAAAATSPVIRTFNPIPFMPGNL